MHLPRLRYTWRTLIGDCSGGFIAALIALPYGLALASQMGLPPVLGLFTSILTAPITALLGRNPVLIGGTASATVPFVMLAVKQQGIGGAAKVSIVASVFMMAFCVMRLGRYIAHVPHAVVSGFSCGIGAMMVITQLSTMLGVSVPIDAGSNNVLWQAIQVLQRVSATRLDPLVISLVVIVTAIAVTKWSPRVPAPLIGVGMAVATAYLFHLHNREVGLLPMTLPPFVGFAWYPQDVYTVIPSAAGLAFASAVNILITSRVVEHFRGRHRHLKKWDADAELGAYGIANVCAGMFGAPMSVGIPARSLASVRCGGTTRFANIIHGLFLVAFLLLGAEYIARIPIPALAGVTAYIGLCLLDWSTWRRLTKMRRVDAAAFLVTACAVLLVNAVAAVALGCGLYGLRWLRDYYRQASVSGLPELQTAGHVKIAD